MKQRSALVQTFQDDENVPFFVLSLKAGGTGLTLTAASHVVHFDRWWNPAVENQATDRAFRIGQKKNVLVHKFVCRGTVEEKIDAMMESKQGLSDAMLAGGGEVNLTEMSDDALLRMVCPGFDRGDKGLKPMSRYYGGWAPYVSVAERRRRAERAMQKLRKTGHPVAPVTIPGRLIATTFWGRAWCENMESYRDYESRLPRGRAYVRNGSVVDLQIARGRVTALVCGSEVYRITVTIKETASTQWQEDLRRLRRQHRFHDRVAAGAAVRGRHGTALSAGERSLSAAIRYPFLLHLPGPCPDVQACRGGALRCRRPARPCAGTAVPSSRRG